MKELLARHLVLLVKEQRVELPQILILLASLLLDEQEENNRLLLQAFPLREAEQGEGKLLMLIKKLLPIWSGADIKRKAAEARKERVKKNKFKKLPRPKVSQKI